MAAPVRDRAAVVVVAPATAAERVKGTASSTCPLPDISHHIAHAVSISPESAYNSCTVGVGRIVIVCYTIVYSSTATIDIGAIILATS